MTNVIDKSIYNNFNPIPQDLQGWNGNSSVFSELILSIKPKHIIEVGTWKGQSAINMGNTLKSNNINGRITCVDTWLGALEFWNSDSTRDLHLKNGYPQIYYQFLSNVVHNKLEDYILPFPTTSLIGARFFAKNGINADMIYIDASHDYEDVLADIKAYYPLLNSGGVMFGDDFVHWAGVKKAVIEFTAENNIELTTLAKGHFWCIRKV